MGSHPRSGDSRVERVVGKEPAEVRLDLPISNRSPLCQSRNLVTLRMKRRLSSSTWRSLVSAVMAPTQVRLPEC